MSDEAERLFPVRMAVSDWLTLSGDMSNEISSMSEEGFDIEDEDDADGGQDPRWAALVELGFSVQQVGADLLPDWPDEPEGFDTWPAPGRTETFSMTADQWELAISAIERWSDVSAGLGDAGDAAEGAAVATALRSALAEQGWRAAGVISRRWERV